MKTTLQTPKIPLEQITKMRRRMISVHKKKKFERVNMKLVLCGSNAICQMGLDPCEVSCKKKFYAPLLNSTNTAITDISTGTIFSSCVTKNGEMYTNDEWHIDSDNDDFAFTKVIFPVDEVPKIKLMSSGNSHTFILSNTGEVWGWGYFKNSKTSIGFFNDEKDQIVSQQEQPVKIEFPEEASKITKICSGDDFAIFLDKDGKVYSVGSNENEALCREPHRDDNNYNKPFDQDLIKCLKPTLIPDFIASDVYCSKHTVFAIVDSYIIDFSSHVFIWGCNNGLVNDDESDTKLYFDAPQELTYLKDINIIDMAFGRDHFMYLDSTGSVFSWGLTRDGILGLGEDIIKDKVRVELPQQIDTLSTKVITQISSRLDTSAAITTEGDLYIWGINEEGIFGNGEESGESDVPIKVPLTDHKIRKISLGEQHSAALAERVETGQKRKQVNNQQESEDKKAKRLKPNEEKEKRANGS